jgi:hypothetical protein
MARHCNNCGRINGDGQPYCVFCGDKLKDFNDGGLSSGMPGNDFFDSFFSDDLFGGDIFNVSGAVGTGGGGGGLFDGIFGGGFSIFGKGGIFGRSLEGFLNDPFSEGESGGKGGGSAGRVDAGTVFSINLNDLFESGTGHNNSRNTEAAARAARAGRKTGERSVGDGDKFEYIKDPLQKCERDLNEKINIVVAGDGRQINPQSNGYEAHKLRLVFELEDEMLLSRLGEYQREQRLRQRAVFCAAHKLCPKCLERIDEDGCPFCDGV